LLLRVVVVAVVHMAAAAVQADYFLQVLIRSHQVLFLL
jgi:hypothetical protein